MIKGINRQILEVTNPESPYFDKILFFVSGEGSVTNEEKVKCEARKIANQMQKPPKMKKSKKDKLLSAVFVVFGIGAGAALSLILASII